MAAVDDLLVVEAPLEISMGGVPLAVVMRTPGHDEDLARGFALTEGIVLGPHELAAVTRIGGDDDDARWAIALADGVSVDPLRFQRNLYATSSCGVCGKASIDAVRVSASRPQRVPMVATVLTSLPDRMRESQDAFLSTGGLHAAAAFDVSGRLLASAEDVGRHNAVDKVVGTMSRSAWPLAGVALMVSGRVSFEIVQKAAVAGMGLIAGVSAPSSLAVELGDELGMTIVGFLRGEAFNVYSGEIR
ncbi:MAG: formate dehydrogenase accessory sulfurtransferase FdhD [Actinobacteria bacterium]|nr:MAG: formate dehydrogenase accessory sulfurtransferase FdhD [Actinomycetota bacterium]